MRAWRSANGLIGIRASVMSNSWCIELQRVQAGARLGGQRAELDDQRLVDEDEPFGDEDQRLRRVDRAQAGEQIAQRLQRLIGVVVRVEGERARLDLDLLAAHLLGDPGEFPAVGTRGSGPARASCRSPRSIACASTSAMLWPTSIRAAGLLLPDHPRERLLDALAVGGERRRRRADAEAGDGDAIRRRQPIDERVAPPRDRHRAAEADVRLIDRHHDQPAAGGALVRAVAVGRRRRRRPLSGAGQRHPFGGICPRIRGPDEAVRASDAASYYALEGAALRRIASAALCTLRSRRPAVGWPRCKASTPSSNGRPASSSCSASRSSCSQRSLPRLRSPPSLPMRTFINRFYGFSGALVFGASGIAANPAQLVGSKRDLAEARREAQPTHRDRPRTSLRTLRHVALPLPTPRSVLRPAHVGHRSHREVGRGTVRQVDRSDARRVHQDPEQVGDVRSRTGRRTVTSISAVELLAGWAKRQLPEGATLEVVAQTRRAHAGDLHRHPGHRRQGRATPSCSTATSTSSPR